MPLTHNLGLATVETEYLFTLDADDVLNPEDVPKKAVRSRNWVRPSLSLVYWGWYPRGYAHCTIYGR